MRYALTILMACTTAACGASVEVAGPQGEGGQGGAPVDERLLSVQDMNSFDTISFWALLEHGPDGIVFTLQAVRADDRMTHVGPTSLHGPFAYDDTGTIYIDLDQLTIPAAAVEVEVAEEVRHYLLVGSEVPPYLCGQMHYPDSGLPLTGGWFGTVPITNPSAYPPPGIDCAGNPPREP